MKKKRIDTKTYTIKLITYNDGMTELQRRNDGFGVMELLGMLSVANDDIIGGLKDSVKPTRVERKVVKRKK